MIGKVIANVVLGVCAAVSFPALAHASGGTIDLSGYMVGSTAYFNMGGHNCSITAQGAVGCDLTPPAAFMQVSFTGDREQQYPIPYVPAVGIDDPSLPAHPQWFAAGSHTLSGGNRIVPTPTSPGAPPWISYAGANCEVTPVSVNVQCWTAAHTFYLTGGQVSGF
jgi:hypothetical protein